MTAEPRRCDWAFAADPRYLVYHDEEWGVPSHDDLGMEVAVAVAHGEREGAAVRPPLDADVRERGVPRHVDGPIAGHQRVCGARQRSRPGWIRSKSECDRYLPLGSHRRGVWRAVTQPVVQLE